MSESILSNEKKCYLTGRTDNLEQHHVFFGPNRKHSDKYGCWVWLTAEMHRGTHGVHGREGHELDLELKRACQIAFERVYGHEFFMQVFGKNYKEDIYETHDDE